jgi:hypothetical protein
MKFKFYTSSFLLFVLGLSSALMAQNQVWKPVDAADVRSESPRYIKPLRSRLFELNPGQLLQEFAAAPEEQPAKLRTYGKIIQLPMPDGSTQRFAIASYHMMEPGLRNVWNFAKTFTGQGIDDPTATLKADFTQFGFHYQILSEKGSYYLDPVFHGDDRFYQVYDKADLDPREHSPFICGVEHDEHLTENANPGQAESVQATGNILRTYRLAIAATGEYTAFHGGTVSLAASAIVTTINRINGVYEKEIAVRLTIVANNNQLIYTNASNDPYTNTNGATMLGQNQTNVTNLIGSANYDIGHVFSTGGGGIAGLGVVCTNGQKARGVTGSNSPEGDPFDIDYVAHEIGHQFGANHTFNSQTGSCGGGNRSASSAYEPGSGTTIMAYAGICGADNTQNNSNAYFHFQSYEQIVAYSNSGNGNTCPVKTNTGNTAPAIPAIQGGYVLPISTPFRLTASQATDVDNDTLTYCWEQFDLGPAGSPNSPTGDAPLFRSFTPVTSRERIFPRLSNIIANNTTIGERLPTYARNLKFKLTVRDNNAGGGGVNSTSISMTVNATGGAFSVTSPNTNVQWEGGSNQTITWNAGSTASAPFNAPFVRIRLSTDGGNTFPFVLADSTANDGTEVVTLPAIASTTCRIMVEARRNIFFDMSNVSFRITAPTTASIPMSTADTAVCAGQTFKVAIAPTGTTYNNGNLFNLQLSNTTGAFTTPVTIGSITSTGTGTDTIVATIPVASAGGNGYKLRIVSTNPVRTSTQILNAPRIKGIPPAAGTITGTASLCPSTSGWFSIPAVSGMNYSWTAPSGSSILSNPDSNAVLVSMGTTAGNVQVSLQNSCGLGTGSNFALAPVVVLPAQVTAAASSITPCQGTSVTFTATPTNQGSNPQYQWLKNDTIISGANSATYSTTSYATGNAFSVILTSSLTCGIPNVDTSSAVTLTITPPQTPSATLSSSFQGDTACTGQSFTFTAQVDAAGGTNPQYAWFRNTTQLNGQTGNSYTTSGLVNNDSIRVRVTLTGTCLTANQVFSPAKRYIIRTVVANAGVDTVICPGSPAATFSGTPAGGTWTGTGITSGGTFTPPASGVVSVTYSVEKYGCTRSDARQVTVPVLPNVTYSVAGNILSGTATGATAWQWYKDGQPINGATSQTYTITESGEYCVEATFANTCKSKSACSPQIFTGLGDLLSQGSLKLVPNPSQNEVQISWEGAANELRILNVLGQEVQRFENLNRVSGIRKELGNLPAGMYKLMLYKADNTREIATLIRK